MKGHGTKFGRKKEAAIAALLTQGNFDEAAKAIEIEDVEARVTELERAAEAQKRQ